MKLIIFIHTCKKYEESRAKMIESTWGNREDIVFITDNPNSSLTRHIYIGEYKKGPTYHPENVIKMFHIFMEKYSDYDYFMMIDDDSYLYVDKLKMYLSFFDKNDTYLIGDFLNWVTVKSDKNFVCDYMKWPGGGPGLVFTKKTIITFIQLINHFHINYVNHDVWLHHLFMLSNKSIKRVHCPGFHQYNAPELLKKYANNFGDNSIISIHLEHNMSLLHNFHTGIGM